MNIGHCVVERWPFGTSSYSMSVATRHGDDLVIHSGGAFLVRVDKLLWVECANFSAQGTEIERWVNPHAPKRNDVRPPKRKEAA